MRFSQSLFAFTQHLILARLALADVGGDGGEALKLSLFSEQREFDGLKDAPFVTDPYFLFFDDRLGTVDDFLVMADRQIGKLLGQYLHGAPPPGFLERNIKRFLPLTVDQDVFSFGVLDGEYGRGIVDEIVDEREWAFMGNVLFAPGAFRVRQSSLQRHELVNELSLGFTKVLLALTVCRDFHGRLLHLSG